MPDECSLCDAPATGVCDACFFFIYCGCACQRAAMHAHEGVADVVRHGCWALGNIAGLPAGQQAMLDAGAAVTIVAAMRAHDSVADVARHGCLALANIVVLPAGKQAAIDSGAAAAIITAIRTHESVGDVARYGCRALANIAVLPAGKQAGLDAGAAARQRRDRGDQGLVSAGRSKSP
jgi:hypothetical protein